MNISNSLPKTFLIYGILLLGILYILATIITFVPITYVMNDIWVEREIRRDLIYIKGTLSFIACIAAIGYVAKKIWLVGKDYESNKFWVYLAISFIVSVSGFLFINNLLLVDVVLNPD